MSGSGLIRPALLGQASCPAQSSEITEDQSRIAIPGHLGSPAIYDPALIHPHNAQSLTQIRVMADRLTLVQNNLASFQGEISAAHLAAERYSEVSSNMDRFVQWHRHHEQNFALVSSELKRQSDRMLDLVTKLNQFAVHVSKQISSRGTVEALKGLEDRLGRQDQVIQLTSFNQSELTVRQDQLVNVTATQDQVKFLLAKTEQLGAELKTLQARMSESATAPAAIKSEFMPVTHDDLMRIQSEMVDLRHLVQVSDEKSTTVEASLSKLSAQVSDLEKVSVQLEASMASLGSSLGALRQQSLADLAKKNALIDELGSRYDCQSSTIDLHSRELTKGKRERADLQGRITELGRLFHSEPASRPHHSIPIPEFQSTHQNPDHRPSLWNRLRTWIPWLWAMCRRTPKYLIFFLILMVLVVIVASAASAVSSFKSISQTAISQGSTTDSQRTITAFGPSTPFNWRGDAAHSRISMASYRCEHFEYGWLCSSKHDSRDCLYLVGYQSITRFVACSPSANLPPAKGCSQIHSCERIPEKNGF